MTGEPEIRDSTMLPSGSSGFTPIQRQRFCSPSCRHEVAAFDAFALDGARRMIEPLEVAHGRD